MNRIPYGLIMLVIVVLCLIAAAWLFSEPAPATVKAQAQNTATIAPAKTPAPAIPTHDMAETFALATQGAAKATTAASAATEAAKIEIDMTADAESANLLFIQMTATQSAEMNTSDMHNIASAATATGVANDELSRRVVDAQRMDFLRYAGGWVMLVLGLFGGGFLVRILWHVGTKSAIEAARYNAPASPYNGPTSAETRTDDAEFLKGLQPVVAAKIEPSIIPGISDEALRELAAGTVMHDLSADGKRVAKLSLTEANWTGDGKPFVKDGSFDVLRKWLHAQGYCNRKQADGKEFYQWNERGLEWLEGLI